MNLDYDTLPGIAAVFVGLMVFFTLYAIWAPFQPQVKQDEATDQIFGAQPEFIPTDSFGRYVRPILSNFLPQLPSGLLSSARRSSITNLIIKSGNPWRVTPEEFVGLQLALGILGLMIGSGLGLFNLVPMVPPFVLIAGLAGIGFLIPYSIYNTRKEQRTKDIQKQLPEALDLLTVTLSSGQTFEPALRAITAQLPDTLLRHEFTKINVELHAGSTLERSLSQLYTTIDSEEAESFAKAIIQGQKTGADVSDTLKRQADYARASYEARLQRMIARLSTTMFIPLIGTMLPAFMIIFIVPTLSQIQDYL